MGGLDLVEEGEGFRDRHVKLGRPTGEPVERQSSQSDAQVWV